MKSKEALRILECTRVTLSSYVKTGKIKATKMANGYYDYDDKSVYEFVNFKDRVNVVYARVSTQKQKNDLHHPFGVIRKAKCFSQRSLIAEEDKVFLATQSVETDYTNS